MQRENFKSRTGFLLVSAGCAIGIGNVWRFPYVTGENGGGLFVLFYLAFLVLMGIPVLTMELAVGRASRKSAVLSYKTLEKPKSKWHIHGWLCMIGCYLLMMFPLQIYRSNLTSNPRLVSSSLKVYHRMSQNKLYIKKYVEL